MKAKKHRLPREILLVPLYYLEYMGVPVRAHGQLGTLPRAFPNSKHEIREEKDNNLQQ